MRDSEDESEAAQSSLTPSDPTDCSLPGSSVHGILRVLEWGAIAFSPRRPGWSFPGGGEVGGWVGHLRMRSTAFMGASGRSGEKVAASVLLSGGAGSVLVR